MQMYIFFYIAVLCKKAVEANECCRVVHNPLNFYPSMNVLPENEVPASVVTQK